MKTYAWTHPKSKRLYARVRIRQPNGKYKTYLKRARSVSHTAELAREIMLELVFAEVREMSFDEFKERISKIYEH